MFCMGDICQIVLYMITDHLHTALIDHLTSKYFIASEEFSRTFMSKVVIESLSFSGTFEKKFLLAQLMKFHL